MNNLWSGGNRACAAVQEMKVTKGAEKAGGYAVVRGVEATEAPCVEWRQRSDDTMRA